MNYDGMAQSAVRQIAGAGRTVTLRHKTDGNYLPDEDVIAQSSETDEEVIAVITDYSDYRVDGEMIKRGDRKALIAATGLDSEPVVGDSLIDSGTEYKIVNVQKIMPGDTALLYKAQVRK